MNAVTAVAKEVRAFLKESYGQATGYRGRGKDSWGNELHVHRKGNAKGVLAELVYEGARGWAEEFVEAYNDDMRMQERCADAEVEVGMNGYCLEVLDPDGLVYQ